MALLARFTSWLKNCRQLWTAIMSSVAKTVAFSPLRRGQLSLKNTLDTPFKYKWPDVPAKIASEILLALEESLLAMKGCFPRRQQMKKKPRLRRKRKSKMSVVGSDSEPLKPPKKKQCLEKITCKPEEDSASRKDVLQSNKCTDQSVRRSQLVIGVNNVTRCLERGELCAGCVCLSAKPALVTRHILMLAATRSVPFAALPNLSQTIVEGVGDIKSALAIGFKTSSGSDFSSVIQSVSKLAPPIVIPWLTAFEEPSNLTTSTVDADSITTIQPEATPSKTTRAREHTLASIYTPVNIKKTISGVRKRKGKK